MLERIELLVVNLSSAMQLSDKIGPLAAERVSPSERAVTAAHGQAVNVEADEIVRCAQTSLAGADYSQH